jgi:phosphate transport system substrate-binding protein
VADLIQALGMDGIGYISAEQMRSQSTLRAIPIDQKLPEHLFYPYQRFLSYAYQNPPNPAAQAFVGYVLSSQGQGQLLQSDSAPKGDD